MEVHVDATTLIALGTAGEPDLLACVDGTPVVPELAADEVTTEPARTSLRRFRDRGDVRDRSTGSIDDEHLEEARHLLDETDESGDGQLVAAVLAATGSDTPIGVVSDDRRVRTLTDGLGATVTGTIGIVVRAVGEGCLSESEAKGLVRRLDDAGLHMTGELRERADELIEAAAEE